jgi:transposase
MTKRKIYSEEFKKDAVRLLQNRGSRTIAEVALGLAVSRSVLDRWHRTYSEELSQGPVRGQGEREDVERLRRKLRELEMENALLKKAAALFAREVR